MFAFDPTRLDLAREFRASPWGNHSPDLQYLLNLMRRPTDEPFHVLLIESPGERWRLAVMQPGAPGAPRPLDVTFNDAEAAEWEVFRRRWARLAGLRMLTPNWPDVADAACPHEPMAEMPGGIRRASREA